MSYFYYSCSISCCFELLICCNTFLSFWSRLYSLFTEVSSSSSSCCCRFVVSSWICSAMRVWFNWSFSELIYSFCSFNCSISCYFSLSVFSIFYLSLSTVAWKSRIVADCVAFCFLDNSCCWDICIIISSFCRICDM